MCVFSYRQRSWSDSVLSVLKSSLSSLRRYADSDWQLIRVLGSSPTGTHTLSRPPPRPPQYARQLLDFNDPVSHLWLNKDCWYPVFFNEAANSCRIQLLKVVCHDLMSSGCKFSLCPASLFALLAALLLVLQAGSKLTPLIEPEVRQWLTLPFKHPNIRF